MGSRARARWERRQFRRLTRGLDIGAGFGESPGPRHHLAKDALGAVVTLAVAGLVLLQVTYGLASRCGPGPGPRGGPGACSGMAAFARHAELAVTVSVAACGALAVLAFIWYMLWGYKTNGQASRPGTP